MTPSPSTQLLIAIDRAKWDGFEHLARALVELYKRETAREASTAVTLLKKPGTKHQTYQRTREDFLKSLRDSKKWDTLPTGFIG